MIGQQRDNKVGIDNPGKVATFGGTVENGETYRLPLGVNWLRKRLN